MYPRPRTISSLRIDAFSDALRKQGWSVCGIGRHSPRAQLWLLLQMAVTRLAQYAKVPAAQIANALAYSLHGFRRGAMCRVPRNPRFPLGRPLDWDFRPEPIVCPACGTLVTSVGDTLPRPLPPPSGGGGGDVESAGVPGGPEAGAEVDPAGYSHQ